jgi:hypothetical protein
VRKVVVRLWLCVAGLTAIPLAIYVKAYLDAELPPPLNGPIFNHISTSENVPYFFIASTADGSSSVFKPRGSVDCSSHSMELR